MIRKNGFFLGRRSRFEAGPWSGSTQDPVHVDAGDFPERRDRRRLLLDGGADQDHRHQDRQAQDVSGLSLRSGPCLRLPGGGIAQG